MFCCLHIGSFPFARFDSTFSNSLSGSNRDEDFEMRNCFTFRRILDTLVSAFVARGSGALAFVAPGPGALQFYAFVAPGPGALQLALSLSPIARAAPGDIPVSLR